MTIMANPGGKKSKRGRESRDVDHKKLDDQEPAGKSRAVIVAALIGAVATVAAAVIGIAKPDIFSDGDLAISTVVVSRQTLEVSGIGGANDRYVYAVAQPEGLPKSQGFGGGLTDSTAWYVSEKQVISDSGAWRASIQLDEGDDRAFAVRAVIVPPEQSSCEDGTRFCVANTVSVNLQRGDFGGYEPTAAYVVGE